MSSGAYQGRIFGMLRRAVLGVLGTAQRLLLALPGLVRRCQQRLHDFAVVLRLGGAPSCRVQRRPLSKGRARQGEVDASLEHLPHGHQIPRAHLAAEDDRLLRIGHRSWEHATAKRSAKRALGEVKIRGSTAVFLGTELRPSSRPFSPSLGQTDCHTLGGPPRLRDNS